MHHFDYENLQFSNEKENNIKFNVQFKQSKDTFLSMNTFSSKICDIENLFYKDELLNALYLYTAKYPLAEIVLLGSDSYPLKQSTQLPDNELNFSENISTFCNYRSIISVRPSTEVLEKNYFLFVYSNIHTSHKEIFGTKSTKLTAQNTARQYRVYRNDKEHKFKFESNYLLIQAIKWITASFYPQSANSFTRALDEYLEKGNINYESFNAFVRDYIRASKKNSISKRTYIDKAILDCYKKSISYFEYAFINSNEPNIRKDNNSKHGNIYESSRKHFSNRLMKFKRPVVAAVLPDGNFKVFCINHLIDERITPNNIKLTNFKKNSPGLFELSVIMGFISLFIRLGRERTESELRQTLLKSEIKNSKLVNEILKSELELTKQQKQSIALMQYLKDQGKQNSSSITPNDKVPSFGEVIDAYETFLNEQELIYIDSAIPYSAMNFRVLKDSVYDEVKIILADKDFLIALAEGIYA